MLPRIFRKSDGYSIYLALIPIFLWVSALFLLSLKSSQPFSLHFPTLFFAPSPDRARQLISSSVTGIALTVGSLLLTNATSFGDRVKFVLLYFGMGLVFRIFQCLWILLTTKPEFRSFSFTLYDPWPEIVGNVGFMLVILGLLNRGKHSVKAVATFICSIWIFTNFGLLHSIPAMSIGLIGGAAIIFLANYFQQLHERELLEFDPGDEPRLGTA